MTSPATAVELAAAQIDLAIREAQAPVDALGAAIGNLSVGVSATQDTEALRREIATCVESLQFFDRLTQHLSHVRDLLLDGSTDMAGHDPELWRESCTRIRSRLISDDQRDLFDLLVGNSPGSDGGRRHRPAADDAGSIELF